MLRKVRHKPLYRPCLCPALPNVKRGMTIIADGGANADCKPINLVQFAGMSNIYASKVLQINNPKVALANIGIEEGKGNDLVHREYIVKINRRCSYVCNEAYKRNIIK